MWGVQESVIRMTQRFMFDYQEEFQRIDIATIGRKGYDGLSRLGFTIARRYEPHQKVYDFLLAKTVAEEMCTRFLAQELDVVYLISIGLKSAITQEITVEQLLPVVKTEIKPEEQAVDFIYEPDQRLLLDSVVPRHFATRLYQAILESFASEQGARMTAMENATRNAKEMTEKLTLQYNRVIAAITRNLNMGFIGGAEAL